MDLDKTKTMDRSLSGILGDEPPIFTGAETSPPGTALPAQTRNHEPEAETALTDALSVKEHEPTMAARAKAVLAGLNHDSAIRLRWAMRDIRGKRTKFSPVSENDLAALVDFGFVEMREGIPTLSN